MLKSKLRILFCQFIAFLGLAAPALFAADPPKPLKALLVLGGCCHDYAAQKDLIKNGIEARAHVSVDIEYNPDRSTKARYKVYEKPDWAKGYDVIIHDECSADVKDVDYVRNILAAHRAGVPAVALHCAMHSFRVGEFRKPVEKGTPDAMWFEFLGLQSTSHGPQEPIEITFVDPAHPVTKGLAGWTTGKEELYNNIKIFDTATPLARGKQITTAKDGTTRTNEYVVAWANNYHGARVFCTTLGHNNALVGDDRYLELLTRGLLWASGKLEPAYRKPYTPKPSADASPAPAKDAIPVKATASSEEKGKGNFAWKAADGDPNTRWCASGPQTGEWLQFDLGQPRKLAGCRIQWESDGTAYRHKVEGSADGKTWRLLADASANAKAGRSDHTFDADGIQFVRVTFLGSSSGGWGSIREFELKGLAITAASPAATAKGQAATAKEEAAAEADPFSKGGNIKPVAVKPTPEKEAEILKDVKVADGFDVTLFAAPPMVNYPVFVAAAPDGTVFVSSDGNGSIGRNPNRGRIIRLRDLDGDGRADEVKEFVKDVDSPRGLVWDHDRLYLLHPPHISAFIDRDGDGVADEQKILVKNIAFTFKDRPADHTSNGLELGIDGWLYAAIGDFGFMEAEGTDGRKLQLRAGGVVRVRPDGTGLELVARGTRNILEAAVSPLLDAFARDNTNDGDGWDVRFHHFTAFAEHGYPSLYKNFNDEIIKPLADYGGGSGCGAAWIDEPGFPAAWNNAPFTADWGRSMIYRHKVEPKGATFAETEKPAEFIKATRVTDLDVDASSRVYAASWKGATFNWAGPDVGYLIQVRPKGYKPEPLPDFAKASEAELVKLLESPSHRTRREAQRTLVRRLERGQPARPTIAALESLAAGNGKPLASRVAAMFALKQALGEKSHDALSKLSLDSTIASWAIRALTDHEGQIASVPAKPLLDGLKSPDARVRQEAVVAIARLGKIEHAAALTPRLADSDPVVAHTAVHALARLGAADACFAVVDSTGVNPKERSGALRVLQSLHQAPVMDGLIARLNKESDPVRRQGLLTALCRLHFIEGKWKGESWGTRPDTRGPYYQPEKWAESDKIAKALKGVFDNASGDELSFLAGELNRHRVDLGDTLGKLIAAAKTDAAALDALIGQISRGDSVPAEAVPLLIQAARSKETPPPQLGQAVVALSKVESPEGTRAILGALPRLKDAKGFGKDFDAARNAFLGSPKLDVNHATLEAEAAKVAGDSSLWADAALVKLTSQKSGSPEARDSAMRAIDDGWTNAKRRAQIITAAGIANTHFRVAQIVSALDDSDKGVATAAANAIRALRIDPAKFKAGASEAGPQIGDMKIDDVLAAVMKAKGDAAVGAQFYTQQACANCHTVSTKEPLKGPFLGNIATIYKRKELAEAILVPNKTLAQGFVTQFFELKDGTEIEGFIIQEAADKVTVRNVLAQEVTIATKDIVKREKMEKSLMPEGLVANLTVKDFASLLDYLEGLAGKE